MASRHPTPALSRNLEDIILKLIANLESLKDRNLHHEGQLDAYKRILRLARESLMIAERSR